MKTAFKIGINFLLLWVLPIPLAAQDTLDTSEIQVIQNASGTTREHLFSAATNLLSIFTLGTIEADMGYGFSRHYSVHIEGIYNPYSWPFSDRRLHNKQATVAIQGRYWPWFIYSGWYFSGKVQHSIFNRGGWRCPKIKEGTATGIGAEIGYDWMVSKLINLEFAAGCWGGWENSRTYASARCGKLLAEEQRHFFRVDRLTIALQFIF